MTDPHGSAGPRATAEVGARIAARLRREGDAPPALVAYQVAGHPDRERFRDALHATAAACDLLEIGLPFSDPVADGPVIAAAGRAALARGATLPWLLETLGGLRERPETPLVLMTYLNPLLAFGLGDALLSLAQVGVEGLIVPDLPLEEGADARTMCDAAGLALVQLVAPTTPDARVERLCGASRGFVYAVARTGITGSATRIEAARAHLERVRRRSPLPVAAGFGIRDAAQVAALAGVVDAAVVGTALVEATGRGEDPADFLRALRPGGAPTDPSPETPAARGTLR